MALEIEVKVLEIDRAAVEARLAELGAKHVAAGRQRATVLDFPDRRLLGNGAYVRVRREETGQFRVTYKAKQGESDQKVCEEIEFAVDEMETPIEFLTRLGLEVVSVLEKDRATYQLGSTIFCLDQYPNLPVYLEIEAPSSEAVAEGLIQLGFAPDQANSMGPVELFAHYGLDLADSPRLVFDE